MWTELNRLSVDSNLLHGALFFCVMVRTFASYKGTEFLEHYTSWL